MVRVRVPATSANLGPGFDCLGMALDLHNTVEMEATAGGVEVTAEGEGAEALAGAAENLVVSAARRLFAAAGREPAGFRLRLINTVPLARGLGSSATAIVGGLVAANALLANPLDTLDVLDLAVELEGHPDNVTPALLGGVTASCLIGASDGARAADPGSRSRASGRGNRPRAAPSPGLQDGALGGRRRLRHQPQLGQHLHLIEVEAAGSGRTRWRRPWRRASLGASKRTRGPTPPPSPPPRER